MIELKPIYNQEKSFPNEDFFYNAIRTLTPVYFEKDGDMHFVCNAITEHRFQFEVENSRREIEDYFMQLNKNNGRYFALYSIDKDVFSFLEWIKENDYHFEDYSGVCISEDFFGFHGNLKEYSAAFAYRIYDKDLAKELMNRLNQLEIKDFAKIILS